MKLKSICFQGKTIMIASFLSILIFSQQLFSQTSDKHFVCGGMPATPYPILINQADGVSLNIHLLGDEKVHWCETMDYYTVMQNSDGFYVYGILNKAQDLVPSDIRAHDAGNRSSNEISFLAAIPKKIRFSENQKKQMKNDFYADTDKKMISAYPSTGQRKLLVILANFNNTAVTYDTSNFKNYMNQTGYNFQGSSGSFKDYYLKNSYNLLNVTSTVVGWVTVPQAHDYYGTKRTQFARDAVIAARTAYPTLDFSQFDNDGDGTVDAIAVIHQGPGQEATADLTDIWSASFSISNYNLTYNGVHIGPATVQPEIMGGGMSTLGVIVHEFGHSLGLPDLYDTQNVHQAIGNWDVMAGGSWNNSGKTPSCHGVWSKTFLSWVTPTVITTAGTKTLRNAEDFPDAFRVNTTTSNEYFLLENRQKTGWDASLPGHGLLILHIDGTFLNSHLQNNTPNNTENHQGVDLVEADGSSTTVNSGDAGDPFPGLNHNTAFTDSTVVNSKSWAGANTNKPITSIIENTTTKIVTFNFIDPGQTPPSVDFSVNHTYILPGNFVIFTDLSVGGVVSAWQWSITPSAGVTFVYSTTANSQSPKVRFANSGIYSVTLTSTNAFGSNSLTKTDYITVGGSVGISEITMPDFTIYPNPSNGKVLIQTNDLTGFSDISICDMTGKIVMKKNNIITNNFELDISSLPAGVYSLILSSEKKKTVSRLMKID